MKYVFFLFLFSSVTVSASISNLKPILEQSLAADFEYQKLLKDVKKADWDKTTARFQFSPDLNFSSSIGDDDSFTSNQLRLSWNLFDGFQDYLGVKSNKLSFEQAKVRALLRQRRLYFDVMTVIFQLIDLRQQIKLQNIEITSRKDSLKIMQGRFKQGLVPEDEVLKLQVDLLDSENRLETLLRNQDNFEEQLTTGLGVDLNLVNKVSLPPIDLERNLSEKGLLQYFVKSSPEIFIRKLTIEKARVDWKTTQSDIYSPSLNASATYANSSSSSDPYDYDASASLSLSWSIFSQLENLSAERKAKLDWEKAKHDLQITTRDISLLIKQKVKEYNRLKTSYTNQIEAEKLAKKFYQQTTERFSLGIVNSNDIAQDLQRFIRTQNRTSQIKIDFYRLMIDINRRVGKDMLDFSLN